MKLKGKTYEFNIEEFKELNFDKGRSIGFIAQELIEVLPEAVKIDEKGFYAVNYSSVIPVIVEAIKEMEGKNEKLESTVKEQQDKINSLEQTLTNCCNATQNSNNTLMNNSSDSEKFNPIKDSPVKLFQNNPNPFSENTSIAYVIPVTVKQAAICVFDMQGTLLRTYTLNDRGNGSLKISGGELSPGMYLYSLLVDGKEADTKRMILTK